MTTKVDLNQQTRWTSDDITEWSVNLFLSASDQSKIDNLPTDTQTELDGKLNDITEWVNISIDKTDPNNPVISAVWMWLWDVVWPTWAINNTIPLFNWTTWKIIKDSEKTIVTTIWSDDSTIPTSKAVNDAISWFWVWDMLSTNNLSDVSDVPTARENLWLEIWVDIEAEWTTLKLDQTIQQEVINWKPIFSEWIKIWDSEWTAWEFTYDWNTLNIDSWLWPVLNVWQETWKILYNNTWATITNWQVVYTSWLFAWIPTAWLANSKTHEKIQRPLYVATHDIPTGWTWIFTANWLVKDIDTSMFTLWQEIYLSPTVDWWLTSTRPTFQDYAVRIGGVTKTGTTDWEISVNIWGTIYDTLNNAWDWGFRESIDFLVSSDWTTTIWTLTNKQATRDLTMIFSDWFNILDTTTTPLTINLVPWTSTIPQANYVYIPMSTKVLTVSTVDFPEDEHIKVAYIVIRTSADTQADWVLVNQNMNDHVKEDNDNGHLLHMAERIRLIWASWRSWVEGSATISWGWTWATVAVTSWKVYQLHKQTFPAIDTATTGDVHIVNHPTTPFVTVSDLWTQSLTSLWVSLANTSFSFVLWWVQNKTGQTSHLMLNLPRGTYSKNFPEDAVNDALWYSNYEIPTNFRSTGFLIARFTFVRSSWVRSLYQTDDLRGKVPNSTAWGWSTGWGVTTFLWLTDTPSAYTWQAWKIAQINATELWLEFKWVWEIINWVTAKTTPVDADKFWIWDSISWLLQSVSWANIKATLKTYFDTLYAKVWSVTTSWITQNTGKLLWRNTASAGAIEEITLWTWLSFTWTTLNASTWTAIISTAWTPTWADRIIEVVSLTTAEYTTATKVSTTLYILTD